MNRGVQLEDSFTILPMQVFWCTDIVSFAPGDNGIPIYKINVDKIPTSQAGVLMNGESIDGAINGAQAVKLNGDSVNIGVSPIYK